VAGPILFTLADTIAYFVTIARSPKGSEAFTTAHLYGVSESSAGRGVARRRKSPTVRKKILRSLIRRSTAPGGTGRSPMLW
jgi:hypothetical protein